jgi:putative ABC transport system permease protein
MAGVPVGRRSLFAERRRAVLGIAGVAAALLMVLVIDGIFAGAMRRVTRYIDTSPAGVFVAQSGVRNMHMASSTVALDAVGDVRGVRGVRWAEPILYESGALAAEDARQLAYVIGYRPGRAGGPVELVAGSDPGRGGIVLDDRAADALGVAVGDTVEALGRMWTVSGLTTGMDNIANSVSYVRFDDFAATRRTSGTASFILVGTAGDAGDAAAAISRATGLEAVTSGAFSAEERRVVRDMAADLMAIMAMAAFLIGLVVVGLTLYTVTLSRLREIGVLKALGATGPRLARSIIGQAAWIVGAAAVVAVSFAVGLGWIADKVTQNVSLAIEGVSLLRVAAGAAVLAVVGGLTPLLKVARIDPASVFRR